MNPLISIHIHSYGSESESGVRTRCAMIIHPKKKMYCRQTTGKRVLEEMQTWAAAGSFVNAVDSSA